MRTRNGLLAAAALWVGCAGPGAVPAQSTAEQPATQPSIAGQATTGQATISSGTQTVPPPPPTLELPPPTTNLLSAPTTMPALLPPPSTAPAAAVLSPPAATAPSASASPSVTTQENRPPASSASGGIGKVVVTSELDQQRDLIAPSLGATTYQEGPKEINALPGGSNAPFQSVLLRAPGVVEDSFGQEHVRGEHANLTYRVNGVLLPEPLNGFGQELDTRLIESVTLIDGSLPAQFGFHTAGIVDVTTKSGATLNHNELSLYGGSYDTIQPSVQLGGTSGNFDYFVVASENHNGIGIENPAGTHNPIHDYTNQQKLFAYLAYRPDDTSRISLLANASYADFEIPDTSGLVPSFSLAGASGFPYDDSSKINENQNEQEYYTVLSYQKTDNNLSYQLSGFSRYGQITFDPDPQRDLIFQGVAGGVYNNFTTVGVQLDASYILNDQHTLRFGAITDYTYEILNTNTGVFPVDAATGAQASDVPLKIVDNSSNHAQESGVYLQDEWHLNPQWTLNYGLRYDRFDSNFDTEDQVSPRVNLVYKVDDATTLHGGYARYFVTPPVQNTEIGTIQKFAGTTNSPDNFLADPPKAERSHYFDLGITHQITKPWQVGVDGFYKLADNLIDLGQFGEAVIESPFNYKVGKVYGAEISTTYKEGGWNLFTNANWVETSAHDIDSQQFQIDDAELNYIADHNIKLDHEAEFSGSAGASYQWRNDMVYVDWLIATGLRDGFANTGQVEPHYPVNVGYEHIFRPSGIQGNTVKFRLDVVNLFDEKYQIRDGSGIGVGAPQYGQRLGFFAGLTYEF
jgi:outer membrane receptor protein involved in Fe transport